jgi:hypothetical protein
MKTIIINLTNSEFYTLATISAQVIDFKPSNTIMDMFHKETCWKIRKKFLESAIKENEVGKLKLTQAELSIFFYFHNYEIMTKFSEISLSKKLELSLNQFIQIIQNKDNEDERHYIN